MVPRLVCTTLFVITVLAAATSNAQVGGAGGDLPEHARSQASAHQDAPLFNLARGVLHRLRHTVEVWLHALEQGSNSRSTRSAAPLSSDPLEAVVPGVERFEGLRET